MNISLMLKEYPKTATLKDGRPITLRPLSGEDGPALRDFFQKLPAEDRIFLKDDVTNPAVIQSWVEKVNFDSVIPILGFVEDRLIADATLHRPRFGWMRHVGEIRVVTDRDVRRQGAGLIMAREIFFLALRLKLEKVVAEMMDTQKGAIKVFKGLGFHQEAVLKDHVMDLSGESHNLVIMSQNVVDFWKRIEDLVEDSYKDYSGA